jgi:hypothetical protein
MGYLVHGVILKSPRAPLPVKLGGETVLAGVRRDGSPTAFRRDRVDEATSAAACA